MSECALEKSNSRHVCVTGFLSHRVSFDIEKHAVRVGHYDCQGSCLCQILVVGFITINKFVCPKRNVEANCSCHKFRLRVIIFSLLRV